LAQSTGFPFGGIAWDILERDVMGRNLHILAGTLLFFSGVAFVLSFLNVAQQPGSPGDILLWRTMGTGFLVLAMLVALAGSLSALFEQAERRADEDRRERRRRRT
jgi:Na+-transporting methylmalonyl-CoA/oxaloacetate decarboxylase gamma subunit